MGLKANAHEIMESRLVDKESEQAITEEQKRRNGEHLTWLLNKLLTGQQLTAEEGRELWYEWICNSRILQVDAMTGNASTYHRLGQQQWPKDMIRFLKDMNIDLFHKMEKEAMRRNKKKEE